MLKPEKQTRLSDIYTETFKAENKSQDPDIPDHEFKSFFGESEGWWIAGVLYKRVLSDEERDRLASFLTYQGGVGQRYQTYTETKRTRKATLILARGGWDN